MAGRTPSQTIGPYYRFGLRWPEGGNVGFAASGKKIVITGRVFDGAGALVDDALIETWQRDPANAFPAPASGSANPHGFGRSDTLNGGAYRIETLMPGGSPPSIEVTILARGLLKALRTRVYLAAEADVRADPLLAAVAASPRVKTLIATPAGGNEYRWDVRFQGEGETIFFAF
ncbi:MAG TPA: protocatechuate 3,4-dioxygenase subunit alpha [Usitatibacter sp.]|nr:protocatechuate 3,4-dioxygenase subunit alpha [Usitatibacter sp.]